MPTAIHGHDVIAMMRESQLGYSRESLIAAILTRFGTAARFHTCSATDMDPAGLVEFLAARGKFMLIDGGFTVNPEWICRH
jgi:hypothetical protein